MPEPTPLTPSEKKQTEAWVQEISDRREEAVQAVLRNFAISRQFLDAGSLSESERLIRFYEGIVMSLQRTPSGRAFEEAESAFKAVLRYGDTLEISPQPTPEQGGLEPNNGLDPDVGALRRQAEYNLAILYHRRAVQLREKASRQTVSHDVVESTEKMETQNTGPDEPTKPASFFIEQSKTLYADIIRGLATKVRFGQSQDLSRLKQWDQVNLATYAAASVGRITLFVESVEHGGGWDSSWGAANEGNAFMEAERLLSDIVKAYPRQNRQTKIYTLTRRAPVPNWLRRLIFGASDCESFAVSKSDESLHIFRSMLEQIKLARRRIAELRSGRRKPID